MSSLAMSSLGHADFGYALLRDIDAGLGMLESIGLSLENRTIPGSDGRRAFVVLKIREAGALHRQNEWIRKASRLQDLEDLRWKVVRVDDYIVCVNGSTEIDGMRVQLQQSSRLHMCVRRPLVGGAAPGTVDRASSSVTVSDSRSGVGPSGSSEHWEQVAPRLVDLLRSGGRFVIYQAYDGLETVDGTPQLGYLPVSVGVDVLVLEHTWSPASSGNLDTHYVYASDASDHNRQGWLPAFCFAVGAGRGDVENGVIVQEFDRFLCVPGCDNH